MGSGSSEEEDKKVKEKIDEDNADKSQHESELENLFSDHMGEVDSSDNSEEEDKKVKEKIDEDNADDNGDKSQHESELDNLFSDHIETANSSDDEDNDYNSRNEDGSEVEINK